MNSYFQTPPVVKNLIIINALVYMATALIQPAHNAIMEYCALWLGAPLFHTYQFVTYMFVHANFEHIFFNMFALWMFGRTLEYELGSKRFLTYYMVCGIGAALIQYFTALAFGELPMSLVGASGQGEPAVAFVDSAVFERICRIQRVGAVSAVDRPVPVADIYMWRRSAAHLYRRLRYFRGRLGTRIAVFRVIGHSVSWPAVFTGDAGITPCQNPRSRIICLKRFFTTRTWNGRMRLK